MKHLLDNRVKIIAVYIIENRATIMQAAQHFKISKTTVHTEVTLQNGTPKGQLIPESIEIKGVF